MSVVGYVHLSLALSQILKYKYHEQQNISLGLMGAKPRHLSRSEFVIRPFGPFAYTHKRRNKTTPTEANMGGCRAFLLLAFSISILPASLDCLASSFQYACDNGTSFPLTYWEHRPYVFTDHDGSTITGALPKIIRQTLKSCCRKEPSMSGKRLQYPVSLSDIIKNNHDEVIVPVGRRSGHGGSVFLSPYLRLIDSPGMAVIVPKTVPGEDLIAAIFDSWPILIFILMSVSLSAIAMWALVSINGRLVQNFGFQKR